MQKEREDVGKENKKKRLEISTKTRFISMSTVTRQDCKKCDRIITTQFWEKFSSNKKAGMWYTWSQKRSFQGEKLSIKTDFPEWNHSTNSNTVLLSWWFESPGSWHQRCSIKDPKTGKRSSFQKRHMTKTVKEAFSLFQMEFPEIKIKRLKLNELCSKLCFLSSQNPHNVCICIILICFIIESLKNGCNLSSKQWRITKNCLLWYFEWKLHDWYVWFVYLWY